MRAAEVGATVKGAKGARVGKWETMAEGAAEWSSASEGETKTAEVETTVEGAAERVAAAAEG